MNPTTEITSLNEITPGYGERALLVGHTGSGKTYLGTRLMKRTSYRTVLVIEVANRIRIKDAVYIDNPTQLWRVKSDSNGIIVYCPDLDSDNRGDWDSVFKWIYYRKRLLVYIDEVYAIGRGGWNTYPDSMRSVFTRGRGDGIAVIACTQRPAGVPGFVLSENDRYYCFMLLNEIDRRKMAGYMGPEVLERLPKKQFYYHAPDSDVGTVKRQYIGD